MVNVTYQHLLSLLHQELSKKKLKIIDYGCGDGSFAKLLTNITNLDYLGLEINTNSLEKAKKNFAARKKFHFKLISAQELVKFPPGKNDIIVAIGVLQYLSVKQINNFFKQAFASLRKGGVLIFSCTSDHALYKWLNIYRLFLPHLCFSKKKLSTVLKKRGFKLMVVQEKGLILTPLFSNFIVFFFDALDKILFKTKGRLGPIGLTIRKWFAPVIKWEYALPIDYGYTLFIKAKKN